MGVGVGVGFDVVGDGLGVVGFGFAVVSFGVVGDGVGFDVVGFGVGVGVGFGVVGDGFGVGVGVGFNASVKPTPETPLTVTFSCFDAGSTYCAGAAVTLMVVKPVGTPAIE